MTFLPNAEGSIRNLLNKLVLTALTELSPEKALDYVLSLLNEDKAGKSLETGGKVEFPVSISLSLNRFVGYPNFFLILLIYNLV